MSPAIKITKDEINALPLVAYEGPVTIVDTNEGMNAAIAEMRKDSILGFDTESRPSFKKGQNYPVSLVQLGGAHHIWLFQIQKFENLRPLWKLFTDSKVIKAGVAIQDDIRKLQELHKFKPAGFIEIATLTQQAGILNTGLRSLAALLLNARISKRAQVSNWSKAVLTDAQVQYACTDAWMSRRIYMHMLNLRKRASNGQVGIKS